MIELEQGEARRIGEGWIEVEEGRAWVTWKGSGDVLLRAGDSCRAGRGAIAQALRGRARIVQRAKPAE